ncbi:MAG TPA: hypothetical protein PKM25_11330 [Candidatus Ozemobacteraceae bacterium]|nr:hypothetical protein [Candidatus Ozemobacteraceae bacterium]
MDIGKEAWKWGLVLILLSVFLLVGHQAYVAVTTQEDYPPPDDYKQGDSFDVERNPGPGAGQPMDIPTPTASAAEAYPEQANGSGSAQLIPTELPSSMPDSFQNIGPEPQPAPDWNQIKDPSQK